MRYCIISNVNKDELKSYCYEGEEFKQILSSPYLVSNKGRIWYNNTIYYEISLDDFFKYVLHKGEE